MLVVSKLDRLAPDLLLQLTIIDRLAAVGAEVILIEERDVDGPEHMRELVRKMLGSIAQYERAVVGA